MGPHYENFRAIVEKLLAADAITVVEIKEIPSTFQQLLTNENAAREMGARARKVFESDAGGTEAAADALLEIVGLGTGVRL
jgi:3-deoxy-D-manno-octulosonic-acid transferase